MSRGENLLIRSVKKYCTALRFLTVIPVSFGSSEDQSNFHSSVPFFPVVGMTIGLLAVVLSFTLLLILPQQVVAFIMIVFLAFICNCLHLDGAADTADGLLSSR